MDSRFEWSSYERRGHHAKKRYDKRSQQQVNRINISLFFSHFFPSCRIQNSSILGNAFTKLLFNLTNSWQVYDPVLEFNRLGVPNSKWRITHSNHEYRLCSTYPSILAVPHAVTDETLGFFIWLLLFDRDVDSFFRQLDLRASVRKVGFQLYAGCILATEVPSVGPASRWWD